MSYSERVFFSLSQVFLRVASVSLNTQRQSSSVRLSLVRWLLEGLRRYLKVFIYTVFWFSMYCFRMAIEAPPTCTLRRYFGQKTTCYLQKYRTWRLLLNFVLSDICSIIKPCHI